MDDLRLHGLAVKEKFSGALEHIDRSLALSSAMELEGKEFEVLQLMPIPLARGITQFFTLDSQATA